MTNSPSHRPGRWGPLKEAEEEICPVSGDYVVASHTDTRASGTTPSSQVYDKLRVFVLPSLMPLSDFLPASECFSDMGGLTVHSILTSRNSMPERYSSGDPTQSTYSVQGVLLKEGRLWRFDRVGGTAVTSEGLLEDVRGSPDLSNWQKLFRNQRSRQIWLGTCDLSVSSGRNTVKVLEGHDLVAAMPRSAGDGPTFLMWEEKIIEKLLSTNGISKIVGVERQSAGLKKVMKLVLEEETA